MLFTKYFHIKLIAVLLTCSSIVVFGQSVSEMKRAQMTKQKSKQVNKPAMRTEEAVFDAMRACMEGCDQLSREECMNQCWEATSGVSANVVTRGDSQESAEGKVKVIAVKHRPEDLRQIKKVQQILLMSAGVRSKEKIEILAMILIEQWRQVPHVQ